MTLLILIWRNLWRSRTRTILTCASLAFSLFLLTILSATLACMESVAAATAEHKRLVVHHKTTVTKLLPLSHGPRLAAIPGVKTVCGMRWFGGRLERSQEQFPSMAVDAVTFPTVFDDFNLTAGELSEWNDRRTAAVLGVGLANRIGCGIGGRDTLFGTVPPYLKVEFQVTGITHSPAYPNVFVFRLDYLLEALRADPMMPPDHDDAVNLYWVRTTSPDNLDDVRAAVDATFAHGSDATMTESEFAFVSQFTKMFGDIPALVRNIGLIVMASILLVVCNTMSTAVRERIGELAVLKALGFGTSHLLGLLFGEAAVIGLIGSVGCLVAILAFGLTGRAGLSMPYFPIISVSPTVAVLGVVGSIVISLAAALPPARHMARLSVTAALRNIA